MDLRPRERVYLDYVEPFDFYLTCSAYSLPWEFNGSELYSIVSVDPLVVARVLFKGDGL